MVIYAIFSTLVIGVFIGKTWSDRQRENRMHDFLLDLAFDSDNAIGKIWDEAYSVDEGDEKTKTPKSKSTSKSKLKTETKKPNKASSSSKPSKEFDLLKELPHEELASAPKFSAKSKGATADKAVKSLKKTGKAAKASGITTKNKPVRDSRGHFISTKKTGKK